MYIMISKHMTNIMKGGRITKTIDNMEFYKTIMPGLYQNKLAPSMFIIPRKLPDVKEENIKLWNEYMDSIRDLIEEFRYVCDNIIIKETLNNTSGEFSFNSYIYTNNRNINTDKLFVFIHGGDDQGKFQPPKVDRDLLKHYILKHMNFEGDNEKFCEALFNTFEEINKKHGNPYKLNAIREGNNTSNLNYIFDKETSRDKDVLKVINEKALNVVDELGLRIQADLNDAAYGMFALYSYLVNNGVDVAVLHYNGRGYYSIDNLKNQLKQISDSKLYKHITLCGHSYGGYLTSLLLVNDTELLNSIPIENLIISAPLVTEMYLTGVLDYPNIFHTCNFDPVYYIPNDEVFMKKENLRSMAWDVYWYLKEKVAKNNIESLEYKYNGTELSNNSPLETYFNNYESHLIDIPDDLVSTIINRYKDKISDYTKGQIIKDLSTYYMYSLPLSLHACIPTQKLPDTYKSYKNKMSDNIASFKGNIYIACGIDDKNTLYNVEFRDLYNNLMSMRKNKEITTLSIEGFGHEYIRADVANEMLLEIINCTFNKNNNVKEYKVLERIELYPENKRTCTVHINNPQFDITNENTGYNNSTIKNYLKNIMVIRDK